MYILSFCTTIRYSCRRWPICALCKLETLTPIFMYMYSTIQVYQRSNSQVRHIPPKMSDKFASQHSLSPPTYSSQNVRQICESTLSKSDYLVGHFGLGRTIWSDVRVDIKRFFFYISRGEYVKHFVIDAYL